MNMKQNNKKKYQVPTVQVVDVQITRIMCASGGPFKGFSNNGSGQEQYQW